MRWVLRSTAAVFMLTTCNLSKRFRRLTQSHDHRNTCFYLTYKKWNGNRNKCTLNAIRALVLLLSAKTRIYPYFIVERGSFELIVCRSISLRKKCVHKKNASEERNNNNIKCAGWVFFCGESLNIPSWRLWFFCWWKERNEKPEL